MDVIVADIESVDLVLVFRVNIVSIVVKLAVFLSGAVASLSPVIACPNAFDEVLVRGKLLSV